MSKKLISVMLALVMVLSVFSVSAFAAVNVEYETFDEETEDAIAYTQYWSIETDNVANAAGEYTVNVCLETNYVVGAMSFVIKATGATIKAATEGDAITEGYNADVQISDDGNKVFIIPDPSYEGENGLTLEAGSVIATLTYTLDEGVQTATLDLINDAKTVDNSGDLVAVRLDDETLSTETMFYGQRVIDAEGNDIEIGEVIASVTLGEEAAEVYTITFDANGGSGTMDPVEMEAGKYTLPENLFEAAAGKEFLAWDVEGTQYVPGDEIDIVADVTVKAVWKDLPADLAKKASAEAGIIIDTVHKFGDTYNGVVFGFTQAATNTFMNTNYLNNAFEATNGGSLAYSRSIGKTGYGTGTVITVKNADGTEAAKYVVVIFGDVDGNGLINANDTNLVRNVVAKTQSLAANSVQTMSANCQNVIAGAMMHTINANDTNVVRNHVGGTKIDQAALATRMSTLTTTNYK